jgi:acetyl esterase/lipase
MGQDVERNAIYGMYSGLALLMDVYHPRSPKGYGIVFISGSGWSAPMSLDATPLVDSKQSEMYAVPLAEAGYTVFSINHRALPRFHYPAAVEDAQRAVRYVRYHAAKYGIRCDRIGAMGGSSGGHLACMLGLLDGAGDLEAASPIERECAKVQCVVARAPITDFFGLERYSLFLGMRAPGEADVGTIEHRAYAAASPISHVSPGDPPTLLIHGDADDVVPYAQSEALEAALRRVGVVVELLRVPGGGHAPAFPGASDPPDYIGEMIRWFDRYLCEE